MSISRSLIPPGKWRFYQKENDYWIEAQTFDELVASVTNSRISNGIEVGSVERDVEEQLERYNPGLSTNMPPIPSFLDRIKTFAATLYNFVRTGGVLVDQATANARAGICLGCHNNVDGQKKQGCCGNTVNLIEQKAIEVIRSSLIQNRSTTNDMNLKMCSICSCDLKIKIWFPKDALGVTKESQNAWPSFCWIKDDVKI